MRDAKDFLNQGFLEGLTRKALRTKTIAALLPTMLPPDLAAHCQVVALENGCLHLEVPDNQWATRLRYQQSQLLSHLRAHPEGAHIASIKYRIAPEKYKKSTAKASSSAANLLKIPNSGKKLLNSLAAKTDYGPLKEILLRLAE